ncbi:MAG: hypothetical protein VXY90_13920, partial [Pseudomonadota bacterium]|nr:hypothetical protein [Pseudomonadota bacterium]
LDCTPFLRTLGNGARAVRVCPIFNGIWTSFLDDRRWGRYDQPLAPNAAAHIADEMATLYDAVGMGTWIGEDFDERVLSSLEAHRRRRERARTRAPRDLLVALGGEGAVELEWPVRHEHAAAAQGAQLLNQLLWLPTAIVLVADAVQELVDQAAPGWWACNLHVIGVLLVFALGLMQVMQALAS